MSKPGSARGKRAQSDAQPDVVIIGGGVMGCAVGMRLAQRGLAVTVIERGIPGAEASSAAAGILGPQWEADGPGPLLDLGLASRAMYPAFAAELRELSGIDIGHRTSGLIELGLDERGEAAVLERQRWQAARGLRAERLGPAELREAEPELAPTVRVGVRFADEGLVHARHLARALAQAAAVVGVTFMQGRYVRRVVAHSGKAAGVELDGEVLSAGLVVVAAGSWSGLIEGGGVPAPAVRPARGQMVAIETRPPLFHHVLAPYGGGYLVPRPDGVALAGSTLEMVAFRKEVTVAGLASILGLAQAVVPALGAMPVIESWSNFRPYTPDQLPVLGRTAIDRLLLATGHHRYGILLAPITGQIITALVLGEAPPAPLEPFSITRFA
jgi:glycine oxidase